MRKWSAGIAAAVAAAGLWMCVSGPEQALAATAKNKTTAAAADRPIVLSKFKKRQAHAVKRSRVVQSRSVKKVASKAAIKKTTARFAEEKSVPKDNPVTANKLAMTAAVANARAEALADDQARNIAALDSTDVVTMKDGIQIAEAEQLTDADRALTDNATSQTTPPAVVSPPVSAPRIIRATSSGERQVVKTGDDDPWNKTSLVGKIFIAFGSLLTLASAARLLIA